MNRQSESLRCSMPYKHAGCQTLSTQPRPQITLGSALSALLLLTLSTVPGEPTSGTHQHETDKGTGRQHSR
ncbi:hypothetical protein E2C01_047144 [Portunus trituberculatus]|uniref:Uncharacterized protein n=1 Tax=Portunus trituberculatus TaxID=210409 RepID=A0A5B7G756_PORTR|nr:hypothetical protein [Portunus trituberculatus]